MRQLFLLLAGLATTQFALAQITGNPNVRDNRAITLDTTAVHELIGAWICTGYYEEIKGAKTTTDKPQIVIELKRNGTYTERRCIACEFVKTGIWQAKLASLEFSVDKNHTQVKNKLEGQWAVYELTNKSMTLTRILTSSGDWKKVLRFERSSTASAQ